MVRGNFLSFPTQCPTCFPLCSSQPFYIPGPEALPHSMNILSHCLLYKLLPYNLCVTVVHVHVHVQGSHDYSTSIYGYQLYQHMTVSCMGYYLYTVLFSTAVVYTCSGVVQAACVESLYGCSAVCLLCCNHVTPT